MAVGLQRYRSDYLSPLKWFLQQICEGMAGSSEVDREQDALFATVVSMPSGRDIGKISHTLDFVEGLYLGGTVSLSAGNLFPLRPHSSGETTMGPSTGVHILAV